MSKIILPHCLHVSTSTDFLVKLKLLHVHVDLPLSWSILHVCVPEKYTERTFCKQTIYMRWLDNEKITDRHCYASR